MNWTYLPVRHSYWQNKKLFGFLLISLVLAFLLRVGPAIYQAQQEKGQSFSLTGRVLSQEGSRALIRQKNGVRIFLTCRQELLAGSLIQVQALGQSLAGQQNPGGFSLKSWARGQGVLLQARPLDNPLLIRQPGLWQKGQALLQKLRDLLLQALKKLLPNQEASLLAALLFGNTAELEKQLRFDFNQAGLAHLTAVSGLHLSCILLPLRLLLQKLQIRAPRRYIYLLLFLLLFASLTGWQSSLSRAVIMTALPLLGKLFLRTTSSCYCLGLAFWLLLLINPFFIFQFGFWLSFSATAGVMLLSRPVAARLVSWLKWLPASLASALAVTLAAQLATAPLLLASGRAISLLCLLANLPAGFLTTLILWLGLIFLPLALVNLFLAGPFLSYLAWPLARLLQLLAQLAAWLARQRTGRIFCLEAAFLFFAGCLIFYFYRLYQAGPRPPRLRLLLLLSVLLLAGQLGGRLLQPPVQAYFFDVGQGDAILLYSRWGKATLIDGGNPGRGREVLLPALDALGIRRLDLVIASHGHADHVGGLVELADYGLVKNLVLPAGLAQNLAADDAELARLLEMLKQRRGQLQEAATHDTIAVNKNIQLQVLAPARAAYVKEEAKTDGNAWSLIILAELAGTRLMLTGDCTRPAETRLAWPQADVLKVAHHGSAATSSLAMLDQVQPRLAVISVGANSYGHPAELVLDNLAARSCQVYRTDRDGAVVLGFYQNKISCSSYSTSE